MKFTRRTLAAAAIALATVFGPLVTSSAIADPATQLSADGERSLHKLEAIEPARVFRKPCEGDLGLSVGSEGGLCVRRRDRNGVLLVNGHADGFYNLTGGSWGLQIGGEDFGYVVFFMNDSSLDYLKKKRWVRCRHRSEHRGHQTPAPGLRPTRQPSHTTSTRFPSTRRD